MPRFHLDFDPPQEYILQCVIENAAAGANHWLEVLDFPAGPNRDSIRVKAQDDPTIHLISIEQIVTAIGELWTGKFRFAKELRDPINSDGQFLEGLYSLLFGDGGEFDALCADILLQLICFRDVLF